ncbi:ama1 protein, putative [Leishmania tarentolae]|uniref:Ama1 protein, putative n=1 Tax=Leishmania tarentolae TaxID=5689 RepID=A0A640KT81_LEITA|nr:ama1 protein, putative [Leishmania tarentolae]
MSTQNVNSGNPGNMQPSQTVFNNRDAPWHYSLCVCCSDMDSCCEACCCFPCQVSRQCNMLVYNRKEICWPYCLVMTLCDMTFFVFSVSCVFSSEARRLARERYGIAGSTCSDCCTAFCCRTCSTQQVLLEMTVMSEFPGATCYDVASYPTTRQMA